MMVSPEVFIDEYREKTYTELVAVRDKLISEIKDFEMNKDNKNELMIMPSPEVVYQCNLTYLAKLCDLIAEKYNREFIWNEVDE